MSQKQAWLWNQLLNFGHGKLRKVIEKIMEGYGIFKASKSTNPHVIIMHMADSWELSGLQLLSK